jgi:hypothetical protein
MLWVNKVAGRKLLTASSRCVKLWDLKDKHSFKADSARRLLKNGKGLTIPKTRAGESVT